MKTIKILIAAPEELHEEKLEFSNLIEQLNEVLAPRGIELERIKWNPETDGSIDDYTRQLQECEMCLTLYWCALAGHSKDELDIAYRALKDGENPRNIYVFFKEPSPDLTAALQDFKANFVTNYGHFFCRFENVDTMNLQFILQFEAYQNRVSHQEEMVKVSGGKVSVGDKALVDLNQVPFAAMNKEYRRLQETVAQLNARIANTQAAIQADPTNTDLFAQYAQLANERQKATDEFEQYQKHLYDIAYGFAKQAGEQISERMARAKEQFEQGNAIEADRILNMEEMKREAEQELKQFAQHRQNLEMTIEEFVLKAGTVMANTDLPMAERFAQACEAYEQAISIAKTIDYNREKRREVAMQYGRLLYAFNKIEESVHYFEQALALSDDKASRSPAMQDLALAYQHVNRYEEAEALVTESVAIDRELVASDKSHRGKLADDLRSLGDLQAALHQYEAAGQSYGEALAMFSDLIQEDQETYLNEYFILIANFAKFASDRHLYEEARQLDEILINYCRLKVQADESAIPDLAHVLNNGAYTLQCMNRYEEAEERYKQSIELYKSLVAFNPDAYLPDYAWTLNNVANIRRLMHRHSESEQAYLEVLDIYLRLADAYPEAYKRYVSMAYMNLANIQGDSFHYEEAEANYQKALALDRELAAANPDVYLKSLAGTLCNLGIHYGSCSDHEQAKACFDEALGIYEQLADAYPEIYQPELARVYSNLAALQSGMMQYEESEANHTKALEIYQNLAKADEEVYLPDVAHNLRVLAGVQENRKTYEKAEANYQKAMDIYVQLTAKNAEVYMPKMAQAQHSFAQFLLGRKRYEEAEPYFVRALETRRAMAAQYPDAYTIEVIDTLNDLGLVYKNLKRYDEAEACYSEGLMLSRQYSEINPDVYRTKVAMFLGNMSLLKLALKAHDEAVKMIEEAMAIDRQLAAENPEEYLPNLAADLINMSEIQRECGRYDEAIAAATEGLEISRALMERSDTYEEYLTEATKNLESAKKYLQ